MNWLDRWLLSQTIKSIDKKLEGKGMLSGYRTYIIAGLIGVATVLHQLGYMDSQTYQTVLGALGAGGLFTLRAAVK